MVSNPVLWSSEAMPGFPAHRYGADIQANQDPVSVGKVADDFPDRLGQAPHQGRDSKDLVARRQLRVLKKVDDLNSVAPRQIRLTEILEVPHGLHGLCRLTGDVEAQVPALRVR